MTTATTTQFELLDAEFSVDQLHDIATHGMAQGVAGFIYTVDLIKAYDRNEDEIVDYLDEQADSYGQGTGLQMILQIMESRGHAYNNLNQLKGEFVWAYMTLKAVDLLVEAGHPHWV